MTFFSGNFSPEFATAARTRSRLDDPRLEGVQANGMAASQRHRAPLLEHTAVMTQRGEFGAFGMVGIELNGDDVDPDGRPERVLIGQPQSGQPSDPRELVGGDRFGRVTEYSTGPGLDLDDDQHRLLTVAVRGDHVELAVAASPIPFEHRPTQTGDVLGGEVFTQPSDQCPPIRTPRRRLASHAATVAETDDETTFVPGSAA